MNRLQFGLALFAAGFSIAFLGSSVTTERQPTWDPQEAQSAVLGQQSDLPPVRSLHLNTAATASKWQRTTVFRRPMEGPEDRVRTGMAAKVSLVSYTNLSSTLSTCDGVIPAAGIRPVRPS